jgi:hypothetical protein
MRTVATHIKGEYLSRRAVAQTLGVALRNVDKVVDLNKIRARRVPGCRPLYKAVDVFNVLAQAEQNNVKTLES